MTNEMDAYRQALIEQEESMRDWHSSRLRFAGVDESEPVALQSALDVNSKINLRAQNAHVSESKKVQRGTRVGWDSPEARAKRKGMHDLRSGRITPESSMLLPVSEQYGNAWRTRGLVGPGETQVALEAAEVIGAEMQAGQEYSPREH